MLSQTYITFLTLDVLSNLPNNFFGAPCANYVDLESVAISMPTLSLLLARYLTTYDRRIRSISHEIAALKRGQNSK